MERLAPSNTTIQVEVHLGDVASIVPEQYKSRRMLLRVYEEMPVREFGERLKEALSLSSTPRLLLNGRLVVLDEQKTVAYYYHKHKDSRDEILHLAPIFEEGREQEEAQQMASSAMVLPKKEEPAAKVQSSAPSWRKSRSRQQQVGESARQSAGGRAAQSGS